VRSSADHKLPGGSHSIVLRILLPLSTSRLTLQLAERDVVSVTAPRSYLRPTVLSQPAIPDASRAMAVRARVTADTGRDEVSSPETWSRLAWGPLVCTEQVGLQQGWAAAWNLPLVFTVYEHESLAHPDTVESSCLPLHGSFNGIFQSAFTSLLVTSEAVTIAELSGFLEHRTLPLLYLTKSSQLSAALVPSVTSHSEHIILCNYTHLLFYLSDIFCGSVRAV